MSPQEQDRKGFTVQDTKSTSSSSLDYCLGIEFLNDCNALVESLYNTTELEAEGFLDSLTDDFRFCEFEDSRERTTNLRSIDDDKLFEASQRPIPVLNSTPYGPSLEQPDLCRITLSVSGVLESANAVSSVSETGESRGLHFARRITAQDRSIKDCIGEGHIGFEGDKDFPLSGAEILDQKPVSLTTTGSLTFRTMVHPIGGDMLN